MNNKKKWVLFGFCWLGGAFAGMDASLFIQEMPFAVGEIAKSSDPAVIGSLGSFILFAFLVGWMVGGIGFGAFTDRLGRVKGMALSVLLYTVFTALGGLASAPWEMILCRFMVGVGVGGQLLSISVLLAESWPGRSRAVAIGALITSYQAGVFFAGLVGALSTGWREAFLWGGFPVALAFIVPFVLEEPVVWKERGSLKQEKSSVDFKSFRFPLLIGSATFGALLLGYWASCAWVPTWMKSLLGEGSSFHEIHYAMILHGISAMGGCMLAGPLSGRFGRIPVAMGSMLGAFCLSLWMFGLNDAFGPLLYVQFSLLGVCVGAAQAIFYIYLPELFPTHLRGRGVGTCLNAGRIFTALAVLCMGAAVSWLGGYQGALMLFSCLYAVGGVLIFFGPETKEMIQFV